MSNLHNLITSVPGSDPLPLIPRVGRAAAARAGTVVLRAALIGAAVEVRVGTYSPSSGDGSLERSDN